MAATRFGQSLFDGAKADRSGFAAWLQVQLAGWWVANGKSDDRFCIFFDTHASIIFDAAPKSGPNAPSSIRGMPSADF